MPVYVFLLLFLNIFIDVVQPQLILECHWANQALTQMNEVDGSLQLLWNIGTWMITAAKNERAGRGEDSAGGRWRGRECFELLRGKP